MCVVGKEKQGMERADSGRGCLEATAALTSVLSLQYGSFSYRGPPFLEEH
jgi:hypothetical protein